MRHALAAALLLTLTAQALAQRATPEAALVVEGVVRDVYRSERGPRSDALVQIEVNRAELGRAPRAGLRVAVPAPGDVVYVHVNPAALPDLDSNVRAALSPREQGGWDAALGKPGDATVNAPAPTPAPRTETRTTTPAASTAAFKLLGIAAEAVSVKNRIALRITELVPDGPAAAAGIEVGDVVVGANGAPINSLDELAATLRNGGRNATLAVLNVRDGNTVEVKVALGTAPVPEPDRPESRPQQPQHAPDRSLGIKGEPTRIGLLTTAFKVTEVRPDSPAQAAGIEIGDVIVRAGDARISDQKSLDDAARRAEGGLTLVVRDSRTGREVPVEVAMNGAPANPAGRGTPMPRTTERRESPAPAGPSGSNRKLGLTTEPAMIGLTLAVKVVDVAPGSPAQRAGVKVGDLVTAVDDSAVFAPDLLDAAVAKSKTGSVALSILDARSGKITKVTVDLAGDR